MNAASTDVTEARMLARQPHHPASGVGRSSLRKRFRLFLTVIAVVLVLSAIKAAIHRLGLEFLGLNPLFTSAIAGAIFIIGFLLSSVLSDYKEAERMPTDIRVALEAIHDDVTCFGADRREVDVGALRTTLSKIVLTLRESLGDAGNHADMVPVLAEIDKLPAVFSALEKLGLPANYIVRLRSAQDILRGASCGSITSRRCSSSLPSASSFKPSSLRSCFCFCS